jgi:hypothetical protein
LPAVSKDAAPATPHTRPWFETRGRCPRLTMRLKESKTVCRDNQGSDTRSSQELAHMREQRLRLLVRNIVPAIHLGDRDILELGVETAERLGIQPVRA